MNCGIFVFLVLALTADLALGAEENSPSSTNLPPNYSDKYLLAEPISPNKQFAVIYPRKVVCLDENPECQDYLVALRPFRILTKFETKSPDFEGKNHGGMSVAWSTDSSVALVTLEAHYGPWDIFLFELSDGKVLRSTNLAPKIRERLEPDYRASKVDDPFNDSYHFVFQDEERSGNEQPTVKLKGRTVQVHADATNDPHMAHHAVWEGRFDGIWDIAQGKFTSGKVTRLHAGPRESD